jgi:16S rRNA (cytosine1402-N4)-methyltransferase
MAEFVHTPVLLNECIEGLNIKSNGIYVDATAGAAGHSCKILERLKFPGHLYSFDCDIEAIVTAERNLHQVGNDFTLIHANFKDMKEELANRSINEVDGILFDLGVSSYQLVDSDRGFSYNKDNELDMRLDQRQILTAKTVVNTYSEDRLAKLIYENSDERYARKIAANIVEARRKGTIATTKQLAEIVSAAIPGKAKRDTHPAKRTFQAIRIEVNGELRILESSLKSALTLLKSGGRLCVITFHSLEDKIVKNVFKEMTSGQAWNRSMPVSLSSGKIDYRLVTKHPILPTEREVELNHRSHSAKLRIIEKI